MDWRRSHPGTLPVNTGQKEQAPGLTCGDLREEMFPYHQVVDEDKTGGWGSR